MPLSMPSSGQRAEQEPRLTARTATLMPLPWLAPGTGSLQHVPPSPPQPLRRPVIARPPPRALNGAACHKKALSLRQCTTPLTLCNHQSSSLLVSNAESVCVYKDCLEVCCSRGNYKELQVHADALGGRQNSQPATVLQQPDLVPIPPVEQAYFAEALAASWNVHSSSSLPASPLKPAHSSGTASIASQPAVRPASAAPAGAAPANTASVSATPVPQLQHLSEDGNADIMAFLLHGVQSRAQQGSQASAMNHAAAQQAPCPASSVQPEPPAASLPSSSGEPFPIC